MDYSIIILSGIFFLIGGTYVHSTIRDKRLLESVTKSHRGTETERALVLKLLKAGFPAQTIFHDLYVGNRFGRYSQIDVAVATKVGIIVFEVKKYSGWIFGKGNQNNWTQVLAYGRDKYYFYNPILQNKRHIECLRTKLTDFQNIPFYSVVVFFGDCEFRDVSFIPSDTYLVKSERAIEVAKRIVDESNLATYKSKRDVVNVLKVAVANGASNKISGRHIADINKMFGTDRIYD